MLEDDGFLQIDALLRSGVYALTWRGEVMYIGQTLKLYRRLYAHCSGRDRDRRVVLGTRTIKGVVFDGIWIRPCPADQLLELEAELINRYCPRYNDRKKYVKISVEDLLAALTPIIAKPKAPDRFFIPRRL